MSRAYYNEIEPAAAHLLRCLIEDGVIAPGDVDERSIKDVQSRDLSGYTQCHFFAGGGLWSVAARLAGWSDERELWTGSCPCQPFSVAGKGKGTADERHLWPVFFDLIRECRPPVVMGEQVAGKAGYGWFDGVAADLEAEDYACRAVDIPACAVDAPHIRQRLYWCAVDDSVRAVSREDAWAGSGWSGERYALRNMADSSSQQTYEEQQKSTANEREWRADCIGRRNLDNGVGFWSDYEWRVGSDGKSRRVKPGVRLLADGIPNRVAALRIAGNAIVPQVAAEIIKALMDVL